MDTVKFEKKGVRVVAHRGLSGIERENTNAAFIAAANRSYYGIETDIHRTADGRFIVCHDPDLLRVAGEKLPIEEVSLALAESVTLFDKDGCRDRADLRPSCLENYIKICKRYDKHAVLELKSNFTDGEIAKIIEIIRGYDYLDRVTFIAFGYENLKKVRAILPEQSVQFLFRELTDEIFERLVADRIDVDIYHKGLTPEVMAKLHGAGLTVNCYTVDEAARAEALVAMGVDMITSNILE